MTEFKPNPKQAMKDKSESPVSVFRDSYDQEVKCAWCDSFETEVISPFGGTVSEVLFKCNNCKNTFGWMKWEQKQPS
jgi:hypothetical protein|tara:strand:+ start:687 stop:917 length:231 start_codon:yes stop_codon:yes gene_type:complete